MYKLGIKYILDDMMEIRRRLFEGLRVKSPTDSGDVANKDYVDNADTSPVFYEQEMVGYEGAIVQWQI